MADNFEKNWRNVRQQVQNYCYRAAGNRDDGEDIFQQVAVRAWRGYASFRGECAFLSWALAIARRETSRVMGSKSERARAETSLDTMAEETPDKLPSIPKPGLPGDGNWLMCAAQAAAAGGVLTESEGTVLSARVSLPDCSWEQIGSLLSMEGNACAVMHCRAIPKLRVFLFQNRAELLGGLEAIKAAFDCALETKSDPLTQGEAEVFRRIVLDRRSDYRKPGWQLALRSACGKVVRRIALP